MNEPPLTRWLDGPSVGRESPPLEELRLAMTCEERRSQRQGDGTISIEGTRFEVPVRFRHLRRVQVRYASWDLSCVWLIDKTSGTALTRIFPLDKARNADGVRRVVDPQPLVQPVEPSGIAPLLRKLMSENAVTGLPPAYIVKGGGMTHKLLALYGLKWNPFSADIPVEALWTPPKLEHFRWRMEQQLREGGFALIAGDPGTGKAVALRLLAHHLAALPDVQIGVVARPQSGLGDFYREIGALFGVVLAPHNRWAGFRALREKWLAHIDATRYRPVLLVDEAQEMSHAVLAELRILASADFDSRAILTVVLAGDGRLIQDFRREALLPIASRIRVRLNLDYLTPNELLDWLRHTLAQAGNPQP